MVEGLSNANDGPVSETLGRNIILDCDLIMSDVVVKLGQQRSCFIGDHGFLDVRSGKTSYRIKRPPPCDDDDLDSVGDISLQEHCPRVSIYLIQCRQDMGP